MSISCTALRSAILTSFFFPLGSCLANRTKFCMDRKILPCLQNASQHVTVYLQQFPSYSNHSWKKSSFYVPRPSFLFALGTPLWQSRKTLHEWKDNSVLAKPLAACIFNSFPVIRTASAKNRRFHVPQPTFLFPLETPLPLSRNMLHGSKDNSMLAKPFAACTYLSWIVSKLYDA